MSGSDPLAQSPSYQALLSKMTWQRQRDSAGKEIGVPMAAPYKDGRQVRDDVAECNESLGLFGVCPVSATVHFYVRSDVFTAGERRLVIVVCGGSRFVATVLSMSESVTRFQLRVVGFAWKPSLGGKALPCTLVRSRMNCCSRRTSPGSGCLDLTYPRRLLKMEGILLAMWMCVTHLSPWVT